MSDYTGDYEVKVVTGTRHDEILAERNVSTGGVIISMYSSWSAGYAQDASIDLPASDARRPRPRGAAAVSGEWYEVELYWPYSRGWQFHARCDTHMQAIHVCALERRSGGWTRVWRVRADGSREVVG